MNRKRKKYYLIFIVVSIIAIILSSFVYNKMLEDQTQEFNIEEFRRINYSAEELELFCDIAFKHERQRVRKWETDIKVQILNISKLDRREIDEVDSVIAIITPLITPLKIERVFENGNLFISRNVKIIPSGTKDPSKLKGLTKMNPVSGNSSDINQAHIYDRYHSDGLTLMHELEHALGLEHPTRVYSSALTIGWGATSQLFKPEEWDAYKEKSYRLTELEKTVIRMLYSPTIKSGLKKQTFMQKMSLL